MGENSIALPSHEIMPQSLHSNNKNTTANEHECDDIQENKLEKQSPSSEITARSIRAKKTLARFTANRVAYGT